jgi:hypothetical protein
MRRYTICPLVVVLCVALARSVGAASQAALEKVLKYVPDDTHLAVVVPNLEALVAGCAALGKGVGAERLAALTVADLLEEPLGSSASAVDKSGAFILAVSAADTSPLMIGSVGSVEAWKGATKPADLPGGALLFELGDERWAAVTRENVAVFAREKEDLQRALRSSGTFARRWTEQAADQLTGRQVVLWIDVPAWRGLLDQQMTAVTKGVNLGMAAAGPGAETAVEVWQALLEQVRKLLSETETYVAAARVDGDGVLLRDRVTFKADGAAAKYLGEVKKTKRHLLRGLPAEGSAIALACEWEMPPGTETLNELLVKALFKLDTLKEKVGAEKLEAALSRNVAIYRKVSGYSVAVVAGPREEGLMYCGVYLTGEGGAVQRDLRAVCEMCPDLLNAWGMYPSTSLAREPEKIGGVEADAYRFEFGTDNAQVQAAVQAVYGKDPVLYMAPHGQGVAYAFGPREAARELLARVLAAGGPEFSQDKRVAALFATLSPDPQACVILDAPRLLDMVRTMTKRLGAPFPPVQITGKDLPLIGCAMYLDPQAVRGELFVPAAPVKAIIGAFEKPGGDGEGPR